MHPLYDMHSILLYLMNAFNVMANKERGGEFVHFCGSFVQDG